MRRIGNFDHLAIGERDDINLPILVAESDSFAVRRPLRLITHGAAAARDLFGGFQAVLRHDVQLFFAAHVGNESDARTVGRPAGPLVVRAGRMRQIARRSFFDRRGKDVAASAKSARSPFGLRPTDSI